MLQLLLVQSAIQRYIAVTEFFQRGRLIWPG
jgi:hypothetical protein